ncbi:unnamed protein product [Mesocestoides corti]|uniref:SHNi-TPR domain-containing protein n=1 Tax=Mesocestoides corti TaxID=53468 RepID=A0A0R3UQY1_MESCO|nr:unnamed protein product [Mesocestoides corti]
MRHKDADNQLKVADCLEKLAEIGREIEDHKQATADLLECLELRKKYAPENERLIAETHFQLAVTYSLENNFKLTDASFIQALQHLENHKSKLLALLDVHNRESDSDKCELHRLEVELKEVSGLIAEVGERQKENAESMQQTGTDVPSVENVQEKTLPVDDISHLIKKKRPVADASKADDEQVSKKTKLDAVSISTPKPG